MSRLRVLVLMGGPSTEHEVSVVSGTGVVRAMDPEKYNIHPVLIDKDGTWQTFPNSRNAWPLPGP